MKSTENFPLFKYHAIFAIFSRALTESLMNILKTVNVIFLINAKVLIILLQRFNPNGS